MRAAEAVVVAAAEQQHDRPGVAVGVEQVAVRVEGHAERIDLAVGEVLDPGAVEADAVGIAARQDDLVAVASLHGRGVGPAVVGVEPAVEAAAEGVVHAVGVAAELERPVEDLAAVGLAVAVGVVEELDVGDAEGDHAVLVGIEADRDAQAVGEDGHLVGAAVVVGVLEHSDRVAGRAVIGGRVGILGRAADPEAAPGVERHVHRLLDLGLGGEELDAEAGRQVERRAFLLGRQCIGRPDRRRERVVGSPGRDGRDQQGRREHRRRCDPLSAHVSALRRRRPHREESWGSSRFGRPGRSQG